MRSTLVHPEPTPSMQPLARHILSRKSQRGSTQGLEPSGRRRRALRELEDVLFPVDDAQRAVRGQLPDVARVEPAVRVQHLRGIFATPSISLPFILSLQACGTCAPSLKHHQHRSPHRTQHQARADRSIHPPERSHARLRGAGARLSRLRLVLVVAAEKRRPRDAHLAARRRRRRVIVHLRHGLQAEADARQRRAHRAAHALRRAARHR